MTYNHALGLSMALVLTVLLFMAAASCWAAALQDENGFTALLAVVFTVGGIASLAWWFMMLA